MQVETYNAAAALWQAVRTALAEALELTAGGADVWRTFWAAQQRFFKLLCVSLKTPTVVAAAKKALAEDMCIVIGLQSTGAPPPPPHTPRNNQHGLCPARPACTRCSQGGARPAPIDPAATHGPLGTRIVLAARPSSSLLRSRCVCDMSLNACLGMRMARQCNAPQRQRLATIWQRDTRAACWIFSQPPVWTG